LLLPNQSQTTNKHYNNNRQYDNRQYDNNKNNNDDRRRNQSMSTTTSSNDPQGWVQQPPTVIVKIHNVTTRESLNGLLALVVSYDASRQRYLCLLCTNPTGSAATATATTSSQYYHHQPLSFKAEHLVKASYFEQMQGQYQLLRNDPTVQRHLRTVVQTLERTTGLSLSYILSGALVLMLASLYWLGVSRTLLLLSAIMLLMMMLLPDVMAGRPLPSSWRTFVWQRVPHSVAEWLRQTNVSLLQRIANTPWMLRTFLIVMLVFFVVGMMPPRTTSAAVSSSSSPPPPSTWRSTTSSSSSSTVSRSLLEQAYQLGFDDAQANRPKFHSTLDHLLASSSSLLLSSSSSDLPDDSLVDGAGSSSAQKRTLGVSTEFGTNYDPEVVATPASSSSSSFSSRRRKVFSLGNLMPLLYVARTVYTLGENVGAGHGDWRNRWDWQLARANLSTLPPWHLGMLGLSVYRLVSALLF